MICAIVKDSLKTNSPISNCKVGEKYWIKPSMDKGTVSVAFPNKIKGIAVAGPAPIKSNIVDPFDNS